MAVGLDLLTRIINVNWGGAGVFVAGDVAGDASYNKPKGSDKSTWTEIRGLPFNNPPREFGSILASTYGRPNGGPPIFLLGGFRFHELTYISWEEGIIMGSTDGINFQQVYSFVGLPPQEELVHAPTPGAPDASYVESQSSNNFIHSLVWDGEQFWAGGFQTSRIIRGGAGNYQATKADFLFSSTDGFSWAEAGRTELHYTDLEEEPNLSKTGLMVSHCNTAFEDQNGHGVPDGVWGEDKAKKIKIGPVTPPTVDYSGNDDRYRDSLLMPIGTNSNVRILRAEGGGGLADTGVPGVMGVAFAGGTWWAVGSTIPGSTRAEDGASAAGAFSTDDGITWTSADLNLDAAATTVCGGKADTEQETA